MASTSSSPPPSSRSPELFAAIRAQLNDIGIRGALIDAIYDAIKSLNPSPSALPSKEAWLAAIRDALAPTPGDAGGGAGEAHHDQVVVDELPREVRGARGHAREVG